MTARCVRRVLGPCDKFLSTSAESHLVSTERLLRRSELFDQEKVRQRALVPRIEKIEVKHVGAPDTGTVFIMNKGLSTPFNCAMHMSEWCVKRSILALVDGEIWDMYKPLNKSCDIQFLTFKDENPEEVNKAYWRSCAMMMGYVLETAFKDEYSVELIRAPDVPVISGAFCYDVILDGRLDDWTPSVENLRSLTKEAHQLIHKDLPFESLEVAPKVAVEIFPDNKHKLAAIEEQASLHPNKLVKLYRCGDFVDISNGPHISRTSVCSQYEITATHNLDTSQSGLVRRFQGISLPLHLKALFAVWERLRQRSQKLITEDQSSKRDSESKSIVSKLHRETGQGT
ncbi:39S ribosomal protein L39, mitochondrial isoform X1 [Scyliorhinus canicula]|uniref:39S ribosomal protein L39, mitochondrial isoform X1 n=1 Tax=Scyliorhinus canicula TaxID=7830 RepID=UPI0018F64E2C|nr:39S ribosomal protein L39, mitochondrial isoform X1 [Scyliorhinus canicula]